MICIFALIIFSILGIFSATHRKLAAEAFDCVFRKVTLRKCQSGLDTRLKSKITGTFMKFSPRAAKQVYKHFELVSWLFVILFFVSIFYVGLGGYNFYLYGNCNGPVDTGFCVFDPLGHNSQFSIEETCSGGDVQTNLIYENLDLSLFPRMDKESPNDVLFIGCYSCEYTREVYPVMKELMGEDVNFYFAHFPVNHDENNVTRITNCAYYLDSSKFVDLMNSIFVSDVEQIKDFDFVLDLAVKEGYNSEEIITCTSKDTSEVLYDKQIEELMKTNTYGTPTVFVNGEAVVGPKPLRVYERLLK